MKRNAKIKEKEQPRTARKLRPKSAWGRKLEEILQDMTIDSDSDNSQSDEDEDCDNSQSDEDEDRAICPTVAAKLK